MSLRHSTLKSFGYAINGLKLGIKNEPNFRIHLTIGTLAVLLGFILNLDYLEIAILVFTVGFVLMMELLNTTLEALTNLMSPKYNEYAKIVKDVAASGVLVSAIVSVIIGILLFLPKIIHLVK